jgi:hypothetical protein
MSGNGSRAHQLDLVIPGWYLNVPRSKQHLRDRNEVPGRPGHQGLSDRKGVIDNAFAVAVGCAVWVVRLKLEEYTAFRLTLSSI